MKFSLLLYALSKKLKSGSKKTGALQDKIKEKNFSIQIKTEDNKKARYFIFEDGKVLSKKGLHEKPLVSLVWSDSKVGFKTMVSGSGKAQMKALTEGKLKLEGDAQLALQFGAITKEIPK